MIMIVIIIPTLIDNNTHNDSNVVRRVDPREARRRELLLAELFLNLHYFLNRPFRAPARRAFSNRCFVFSLYVYVFMLKTCA